MSATPKAIAARCEEFGDCLIWKGGVNNGTPHVNHNGTYVQVRRLVYEEVSQKKIQAGRYARTCCKEQMCVKFEHIALMTRKQIGAEGARAGVYSSPQRRAAIAKAMRARSTRLDADKAREIRQSTECTLTLAQRHDVTRRYINRIQNGTAWAEATRGASVFNL